MDDKQMKNFKKQIKESINLHYNGPEDQQKVVVNIMAEDILIIVERAYESGRKSGIEYCKKVTLGWLTELYGSSNALGR